VLDDKPAICSAFSSSSSPRGLATLRWLSYEAQLSEHAPARVLAIGEVAERTGMSASRIRYYESRGVLPAPDRVAGRRRYGEDVLRRLAIIDAAQRVGFSLDEIGDLFGSRDQPAHERLRQLATLKLPELDELIDRATTVRRMLRICCVCNCQSIDECRMFDERVLPLQA
jgi:MerR family redox-sensitive transcriptional activator SoxR